MEPDKMKMLVLSFHITLSSLFQIPALMYLFKLWQAMEHLKEKLVTHYFSVSRQG